MCEDTFGDDYGLSSRLARLSWVVLQTKNCPFDVFFSPIYVVLGLVFKIPISHFWFLDRRKKDFFLLCFSLKILLAFSSKQSAILPCLAARRCECWIAGKLCRKTYEKESFTETKGMRSWKLKSFQDRALCDKSNSEYCRIVIYLSNFMFSTQLNSSYCVDSAIRLNKLAYANLCSVLQKNITEAHSA